MAKHFTIPPYTGTDDILCHYKLREKYYIRKPSSLTGERVKTDPRFRKTMEYAAMLASGSRIASKVYAALPADRRVHSLYRTITGEAMQWLKYKWTEKGILAYLLRKFAYIILHTIEEEEVKDVTIKPKPDHTDWQPFKHRRSIKAFVRNMCDGIRAKKNRAYDRYLEALDQMTIAPAVMDG